MNRNREIERRADRREQADASAGRKPYQAPAFRKGPVLPSVVSVASGAT
jgi:hypothetical protein